MTLLFTKMHFRIKQTSTLNLWFTLPPLIERIAIKNHQEGNYLEFKKNITSLIERFTGNLSFIVDLVSDDYIHYNKLSMLAMCAIE